MSGIVLTVNSSSLNLGFWSPVASGEANTVANVGGQVEVFRDQVGATFNLRTLEGQGNADVRVNGDVIEIDVATGAGGGDVTGPASSTDNAAARFDGATGTVVKNSSVTIDDSGNIATPGAVDGRDLSADGAVLDSHVASTLNPHVVTTTQIGAIPTAAAGAPNGVATLDGAGDVPLAQIPATIAREADLQTHIADGTNPHSVTAAQVGKDTAQWNADELQGSPVATQAPNSGQSLVWTGSEWLPQTPIGAGNVIGPGAANDREIAVFDGGPTLLDNPPATIDNAGNLSTVGTITGNGIALGAHAPDHEVGGGQEITAQDLGSGALAVGQLMESDGAGEWNTIPTPSTVMLTTLVVRKGSAGTIPKCRPVYISGWNIGGWHEVEEAEADVAASMPSIGLSREPITNAADAEVVTFGHILGCDTSPWALKDPLYVSKTAGQLVNSKTTLTGATTLIQKVGLVARVDVSDGEIIVVGAGRSNDIPNLGQNLIWKGDANGQPAAVLGPGPADIIFGANGVTATTTTRYLYPGFGDTAAQTTVVQRRIQRAGALSSLYILHNGPAGNGNDIVYTVRKNGTPTALTVTMASTDSTGEDTSNSVSVAAGDLIDIEVTKAASIVTSPTDIIASMDLT